MKRPIAPLLLGPVIGGAILLVGASRTPHLPDPMATHFGVHGEPNGSLPLWIALVIPALVAAAPIVATTWSPPRVRVSVGTFAASLGVLVQALQLWANNDAADWTRADGPAVWFGVLLVGVPAAAAAVAVRMAPASEPGEAPVAGALALAPGERVVWSSSSRNRLVLAETLALVVLGLAFHQFALVLVGIVTLPYWHLRLNAGHAGVVLSLGNPTVFRRTYPLETIVRASAGDYHGFSWGYRGSRRVLKQAAWVIRRGECLTLEMTDGTTLRITVDDAARGAEVLNGMLLRV